MAQREAFNLGKKKKVRNGTDALSEGALAQRGGGLPFRTKEGEGC